MITPSTTTHSPPQRTMFESLLHEVERGKQGYNWGIPYTITKLNRVAKIQKGIYTLVFAQAGVGKSAFVYDQHLFNTLDYVLKTDKLDIFTLFYNLEVENIDIIGTLATRWLTKKLGTPIDSNHIFSAEQEGAFIDTKLESMIRTSAELKNYVDEFDKRVAMFSYATREVIDKHINELLKERQIKDESGYIKRLPDNDNLIIQVIVDHIGLINKSKGETTYESLVNTSFMLRQHRRINRISPIVIQQVTPQKVSYQGKETVMPDHEDLRGGKETIQDCNRAIAIGSPYKSKIEVYKGYKVIRSEANGGEGLEDRLRIIDVVKNRKAGLIKLIPCGFTGEAGIFSDLIKGVDKYPDADLPTNKEIYKIWSNIKKYGK